MAASNLFIYFLVWPLPGSGDVGEGGGAGSACGGKGVYQAKVMSGERKATRLVTKNHDS